MSIPQFRKSLVQSLAAFRLGGAIGMKKHRNSPVRKAVRRVRRKLKRRHGLINLIRSRRSKRKISDVGSAPGYLVGIPGIGRAAVVKPETLIHWVKGVASLNEVVDALDRRGKLIKAANGNVMRQVKIGDTRLRYYCFALGSPAGAIPNRSKPLVNVDDDSDDFSDDDTDMRVLREAVKNARDYPGNLPRRPIVRFPSLFDDDDADDWSDDKKKRGTAAIQSYGRPVRLLSELISKKKRD
jgi:hypothetical protein